MGEELAILAMLAPLTLPEWQAGDHRAGLIHAHPKLPQLRYQFIEPRILDRPPAELASRGHAIEQVVYEHALGPLGPGKPVGVLEETGLRLACPGFMRDGDGVEVG